MVSRDNYGKFNITLALRSIGPGTPSVNSNGGKTEDLLEKYDKESDIDGVDGMALTQTLSERAARTP